jgi:hypothetical protein
VIAHRNKAGLILESPRWFFQACALSAPTFPDQSVALLIDLYIFVDLHQRLFWPDLHPTGIDRQLNDGPEGPLPTARTGVQSSLPFSRSKTA